ncbi:MAG: DUF4247 domain-containing protein [Thermocrispum sp.]
MSGLRPWHLLVPGGVLAVIGVVLAVNLFGISGTSPRAYVDNNYAVAPASLDRDDARSYVSPERPSEVAQDVVDSKRPVTQYADGTGVYLRYSDDAVVVQPRTDGAGSLILVMAARRAYRTFFPIVGGGWGWSSPQGESFRGRGPGSGK